MARLGLLVALLTLFLSSPRLTTVVPAEPGSFTRSTVFIVDASGSMTDDIGDAIAAFSQISGQPTDDAEIRVLSFNDACNEWRRKWTKLPDETALKEARAWLQGQRVMGNTFVIPALKKALAMKDKLTVVVISDGNFSERLLQIETAIKKAQAARKAAKKRPATIATIGVGSSAIAPCSTVTLGAIGKRGKGGFYRYGSMASNAKAAKR